MAIIVEDRARSRWRRVGARPDAAPGLCFRSLDRFRADGAWDENDGGWWLVDEAVLSAAHAGAQPGLGQDSSTQIQEVLDTAAKLGRPVDDAGTPYRVDRSIVIPDGVRWSGANLQAGVPGMNVVLIGDDVTFVEFNIRGTGRISPPGARESVAIERGIYPLANGLRGATIAGRVSNLTVGVHLQPLDLLGPPPQDCTIDVCAIDIVGQLDVPEGYGVLLSPAHRCAVKVTARNIQRHAVYLSAGASGNSIDADVDGCHQDAVTIYSLPEQPTCSDNQVVVRAVSVRPPQGAPPNNRSACFSIYGRANGNSARVFARGGTDAGDSPCAAAVVSGLFHSDGPFPKANRLTVDATGFFSGPYVVDIRDSDETLLTGGNIQASGRVGIVGFSDTRSNDRRFSHAGTVSGLVIRSDRAEAIGIVVATERSPVLVLSNVRISNVQQRVKDYTGNLRQAAQP